MNKAGKRPTVAEESQPWNNQTVQVYSLNSFWMDDGVWHKMCDWLTELEMSVNAWVAFASKNPFVLNGLYVPQSIIESRAIEVSVSKSWYYWYREDAKEED